MIAAKNLQVMYFFILTYHKGQKLYNHITYINIQDILTNVIVYGNYNKCGGNEGHITMINSVIISREINNYLTSF